VQWRCVAVVLVLGTRRATPLSTKPGKKLAQTVESLKQAYPDATVEAWAEDEHRLGLHPVNQMVWIPVGEQPTALVNWKYQWLWLVAFVQPTTGETYWWIVPCLNSEVFSHLLEDFAQHFGVGKHKRVILVVDGATFHTCLQVIILKEFIYYFCHRSRQSYNQQSGCGLLLMKPLPTVALLAWMN
jgi:hypothetical protein